MLLKNVSELGMGKNPTPPLYSDTTKHEKNFDKKRTIKLAKCLHAFRNYAKFFNLEILNSFNPKL